MLLFVLKVKELKKEPHLIEMEYFCDNINLLVTVDQFNASLVE